MSGGDWKAYEVTIHRKGGEPWTTTKRSRINTADVLSKAISAYRDTQGLPPNMGELTVKWKRIPGDHGRAIENTPPARS